MRIPRNYHDDDLLIFCVYALRRSDCMAIIHYINDTVQVCSPKVRSFAYPPYMSLPCGPVCISWQQQQRAKSKGTGPGYPRGKSGLETIQSTSGDNTAEFRLAKELILADMPPLCKRPYSNRGSLSVVEVKVPHSGAPGDAV